MRLELDPGHLWLDTVAIPLTAPEPTIHYLFALAALLPCLAQAGALSLAAGAGPQPHADHQSNQLLGVDYSAPLWRYSERQLWRWGVSLTHLSTDANSHKALVALSVFPELTIALPHWAGTNSQFFVRLAGPTWLSDRQLGERQQAYQWTFMSQVGLAVQLDPQWQLGLSYRHYSNGGHGSPNDGIDVPFILSLTRSL